MSRDSLFLLEALAQARFGRGMTAPNPAVGALLVDELGQVIGRGFHRGPGRPHAEVEAIKSANGHDLSRATLYCTLEPCCHFGKTPPCTDLILESRIPKVVYGFGDPNPIVSGKGHQKLSAGGVEVRFEPLELITDFYESYRRWTLSRRPTVTYKIAMSLNGKTAGPQKRGVEITQSHSHEWTHAERQKSDAILTTVETIIHDNPRLNVRGDHGVMAKPVYVLDSRLRIPLDSRVFATAQPLVLLHGPSVSESHCRELEQRGAQLMQIPQTFSGLELATALAAIGERGVHDLWVEAGGKLLKNLLRENLIDRLHLLVAPVVLPADYWGAFDSLAHSDGTEFDFAHHLPEVSWSSLGPVSVGTFQKGLS